MTKQVLVIGASGMAGHLVSQYLKESRYVVESLSKQPSFDKDMHILDVCDQNKFKKFLDDRSFDVVINCIGLLVKASEEMKDLAVYLNAYLPRFLESRYATTSTKVIHISTDGVFSASTTPRTESMEPNPDGFYGKTKLLGELNNTKDLTFRTSIIGPDLSPGGQSLFNWFYQQSGKVKGFTNSMWSGVTTLEMAKAMKAAIEQDISGLYHLVPPRPISKFDLLETIRKEFNKDDVVIEPEEGSSVGCVLTTTRSNFDFQVSDYPTMIGDMKQWIQKHADLYSHYDTK